MGEVKVRSSLQLLAEGARQGMLFTDVSGALFKHADPLLRGTAHQPLRRATGTSPHHGTMDELIAGLLSVPEGEREQAARLMHEVIQGRRDSAQVGTVLFQHDSEAYLRQRHTKLHVMSAAALELMAWAHGPLKLEAARGSQWHAVQQACADAKLALVGRGWQEESRPLRCNAEGVMLLEHDWAAVVSGPEAVPDGEVQWPYDYTVLEARLSGHRVAAMFCSGEDEDAAPGSRSSGGVPFVLLFCCGSYGWTLPAAWDLVGGDWKLVANETGSHAVPGVERVLAVMARQMRAVCIALDAEVVERQVVRAPHKLNHQREKAGKKPLSDHYVLRLHGRHRVPRAPQLPGREVRHGVRLHFRRGHWRHFDASKTWINWTLVGDPDLGWVDKEYRL